ncbi:hypothetical protein P7C71_g1553, partial [Lecanoromycetidae sp. Uapishka_2]
MPSATETTVSIPPPLPTPTISTTSPQSPRPALTLKTPKTANFPSEITQSPLSKSATFPSEYPRSPMPKSATLPSQYPKSPLPKSATLPSEFPKSPLRSGRLDVIKQEDDLKTPITPPQAYMEFLKALSPAVSTPSTGRSPIFDRVSGKSTPITQPSSAASCMCSGHDSVKPTSASASMVPPSPYMRPPNSARTPTALRRLRIPQSPAWSPATDSPKSSALSSSMRSPFSPADWVIDGKTRYYEAPRSGTHKPASVRQVITKTVTYTRTPVTPLDPAPKGKKRRLE